MHAEDIKAAVDNGKTVHWQNSSYRVIRDALNQYFIQCDHNGHCIGLTHRDGITLNGAPNEFYVECPFCGGRSDYDAMTGVTFLCHRCTNEKLAADDWHDHEPV